LSFFRFKVGSEDISVVVWWLVEMAIGRCVGQKGLRGGMFVCENPPEIGLQRIKVELHKAYKAKLTKQRTREYVTRAWSSSSRATVSINLESIRIMREIFAMESRDGRMDELDSARLGSISPKKTFIWFPKLMRNTGAASPCVSTLISENAVTSMKFQLFA
jgi:hypothetical protein